MRSQQQIGLCSYFLPDSCQTVCQTVSHDTRAFYDETSPSIVVLQHLSVPTVYVIGIRIMEVDEDEEVDFFYEDYYLTVMDDNRRDAASFYVSAQTDRKLASLWTFEVCVSYYM